jgi:hypothetical protein
MRLFRQKRFGDWTEVFQRIAAELAQRVGTASFRRPLLVETAPGEVLDRITILQIKRQRTADPARRRHVHVDLGTLQAARARALVEPADLAGLAGSLRTVNEQLWQVEDDLRDCERRHDFAGPFVAWARSVYHCNDERGALKRRISERCGSALVEEKFYTPYRTDEGAHPGISQDTEAVAAVMIAAAG